MISRTAALLCLGMACLAGAAFAQDAPPPSLGNVPSPSPQGVLEPEEGSVMFTDDEMARLKRALEIYDSKVSHSRDKTEIDDEDDFLSQLLETSGTERQHVVFPYFFLGSVVYVSPREWTVFINDHKIIPTDLEKTRLLSVADISKTSVRFVWKPFSMPEIAGAWKHRQSLPGPFSPVTIDEEAGTVSFSLKPNQTFFSRYMEVVEGKLAPHLSPPPPLEAATGDAATLTDDKSSVLMESDTPENTATPAPEPVSEPAPNNDPVSKPAPEPKPAEPVKPEDAVEEVPALTPPPAPVETKAPAATEPETAPESVVKLPTAAEPGKKSKLKSLFEDTTSPKQP